MSLKDQKIEELQRELALTRVDFSTRLQKLEQKISALNQDQSPLSEQSENIQVYQSSVNENQSLQREVVPEKILETPPPSESGEVFRSLAAPQSELRPSYLKLLFNSILKEFGILIFNLLSPLAKFTSPAINLYQHYQAKGQGPIFVFMLIGIALLVGGFGYLAQLLVGELGAGSKSLLLFVVAIGITLGGAYLAKREKYAEISSAVVSLGLLLNFVTVYVAGSFYQLLPGWMVLLSYFAIACTGFILANKFDARIVSALAVIGGGAIPLISQLDQLGTAYYLIGLGFIIVASLYQATNKNWQWLGFTSVFVAYSCIEFLLQTSNTTLFLGVFSQIFYCVFLLYICHLLNQQSAYKKELIVLTVIAVFANIGVLYQSNFTSMWILPAIAAVNTVLSILLLLKARAQKSYSISLHTMLASTWMLVAIVSSLAPDYWGFAIGLEGLFILYFALKEDYFSIRMEAYGLLAFAILHGGLAVFPYFPDPALLSLKGILVVASIGAFVFCSRKLFARFPCDIDWEIKLSTLQRPAESIWLSIFILSLLWVHLGVWSALAILPLQVMLLTKSYRRACKTTEMMAYIAGVAIFVICILGINQVQSLSFRELPNYAKVAIILAFAECWLFAEFYRRTDRTGPMARLAEILRLGFYLVLPLVFLPSVLKHYIEFSALAIWCSAIFAYALGRVVKHPFIRTESLIIFASAVLYNLGFYVDFYHSQLVLTCLSTLFGLGLFSYFLLNASQRHVSLLDKKIASLGIFFLAGCIAIYSERWMNVYLSGAFTSGYIFVAALCSRYHPTLLRNRATLGYLCYFSLLGSWVGITVTGSNHIISSSIWILLSIVISLTFLIKSTTLNKLNLKVLTDHKIGYTLQHILFAISGAFLLLGWELALLISPWLILQGSYLFFTHKHSKFVSKLALGFIFVGLLKLGLVDAENALLWQKVTLMIGIGLFMLAAAFIYQKRLSQSMISKAL
jgi:hypothetical protein